MITPEQAKYLKKHISKTLEAAVEAAQTIGSPSQMVEAANHHALDCARDLQDFIETLTEKPT